MAGGGVVTLVRYLHGIIGSTPTCAKVTVEMAGTSGNSYGQTIGIPILNNSPNGTRFEYSDSEMMGDTQPVRVTLYGSDGSQLAQIVKTFAEFTTVPTLN